MDLLSFFLLFSWVVLGRAATGNTTCLSGSHQLDWYTQLVGETPCRTYERLRQQCNSGYLVGNLSSPPKEICNDPNNQCCCNSISFYLSMICFNCQWETNDANHGDDAPNIGDFQNYLGACSPITTKALPVAVQNETCANGIKIFDALYQVFWPQGQFYYEYTKSKILNASAAHGQEALFTRCDSVQVSTTNTTTSQTTFATTSATTTNSSSQQTQVSSSSTTNHTSVIVGVVCGVVLLIVIVVCLLVWRRMKKQAENSQEKLLVEPYRIVPPALDLASEYSDSVYPRHPLQSSIPQPTFKRAQAAYDTAHDDSIDPGPPAYEKHHNNRYERSGSQQGSSGASVTTAGFAGIGAAHDRGLGNGRALKGVS